MTLFLLSVRGKHTLQPSWRLSMLWNGIGMYCIADVRVSLRVPNGCIDEAISFRHSRSNIIAEQTSMLLIGMTASGTAEGREPGGKSNFWIGGRIGHLTVID